MFESLLTKWRGFLLRMFDIRMGELKRVGMMQLNVFLLIQCLWIIKPVVNAQFLSLAGIEKLPLVFLLVALTALAFSGTYSKLLNRMSLGKMMIRTYMISIICLLTFVVLMNFNVFKDWMSYLFYIGVALFGLITTSQFWLMGNLVFSSLEAKRLFGFIGAGAIAGGISGGYVTSLLVPFMDSENLLFVPVGLLMASMWVNYKIWVTYVPKSIRSAQARPVKSQHEFPLRLIRNSKHLSYLALIMGISVVVAKLVEFQFSAIASARIQDPDKLTAYFGFWFSTSNVVSLVIQLLITQRVVGFLGVGRSLLIYPGALFMATAAVLNTPVLWAGTTLKLFDISLKQSINKAATELLILPVSMAIKNQAKTFIDVFVDTTATGIGGILLIFLINGFNLSVRAVCIMILALICIWIYFALRVRKEYILSFWEKLGFNHNTHQGRKEFHLSDMAVAEGMRRTLKSGTTNQILYLLARIEESKDARLMQDVIPMLAHENPTIRQAALRCLYYHKDHTITRSIEPLLRDPDDEVRSRAFSCLLAHTRQDRVNFIDDYLKDPDPAIRGSALVGLATEARDNPEMQKMFNLEQRLIDLINQVDMLTDAEESDASKIVIARAIGYGKLAHFYPSLIQYIKDENLNVAKQAILAAGSSQENDFLSILLELLLDKSTRSAAQKAISRYELTQIIPSLVEVTHDRSKPREVVIQLPALAESMDTPLAIDYLYGLLQHQDPGVRMKALESLHVMKAKFSDLTISDRQLTTILTEEAESYKHTLAITYAARHHFNVNDSQAKINLATKELIRLLDRKRDRILKRLFWELGLKYPSGTILPLYKDIRHEDPSIRINTLELLDNILEPMLKLVLLPILETAIQETLSNEAIDRLNIKIPSAMECLESLLTDDDDQIKLAVLEMIEASDHDEYTHLLHMAANDESPKVRIVAETILKER